AYNTSSIKQKFMQAFDTTIARVSAATFDSNVIPSSTATYDLGVTSQTWRSVNNVLYFSSGNVGVGVASPGFTCTGCNVLEVNGGLRLNTSASQPTCNSTTRGTLWLTEAGAGSKDSLQVCAQNASGTAAWATLY